MKAFVFLKIYLNAYLKPRQNISIDELPVGSVIDIGGGGEGVIAQVGRTRVVAIDQYLSGIEEPDTLDNKNHWLFINGLTFEVSYKSFHPGYGRPLFIQSKVAMVGEQVPIVSICQ